MHGTAVLLICQIAYSIAFLIRDDTSVDNAVFDKW
jgi:hypothetical protein